MSSLRLLRRTYTTKVVVDEQCLPLKPTWSIHSLLQTKSEPITDKGFKHLLSLARLNIQDKDREQKLKREINNLTQFTDNVKQFDINDTIRPLTHIWKENTSQLLRSDDNVETLREKRGRDLLKLASKKSGNFYVVKGTIPSSE